MGLISRVSSRTYRKNRHSSPLVPQILTPFYLKKTKKWLQFSSATSPGESPNKNSATFSPNTATLTKSESPKTEKPADPKVSPTFISKSRKLLIGLFKRLMVWRLAGELLGLIMGGRELRLFKGEIEIGGEIGEKRKNVLLTCVN